jgi:hypothetical protein
MTTLALDNWFIVFPGILAGAADGTAYTERADKGRLIGNPGNRNTSPVTEK